MLKITQKVAIIFVITISILFAYSCVKSIQDTHELSTLTLGTQTK